MEKYAEDLLNGTAAVFEYDYHDRLYNWGTPLRRGEMKFTSTRSPILSENLLHLRSAGGQLQ